MKDTIGDIAVSGRLILKGGHVVDPKNQVDTVTDILIGNGVVCQVGDDIILVDVKKKEVEEPCKL